PSRHSWMSAGVSVQLTHRAGAGEKLAVPNGSASKLPPPVLLQVAVPSAQVALSLYAPKMRAEPLVPRLRYSFADVTVAPIGRADRSKRRRERRLLPTIRFGAPPKFWVDSALLM